MIKRFALIPVLQFILLSLLVSGCDVAQSGQNTDFSGGLRELADAAGINLGTAVGADYLGQTTYNRLLNMHFNHVTAENAMKWHPLLSGGRGNYNWMDSDALMQHAENQDMRVRGHALIWHSQNPGWLDNGSWTTASLLELMDEHFAALSERYGEAFYSWDVVNEAFNNGVHRPESIWYSTIGESYIAEAFTRARTHFPDARLYYNDYNISGGYGWTQSKADLVYDLAVQLLADGAPIDGVGFQMHLQLDHDFSISGFKANLQRFIDLGLRVDVTEIDIRIEEPISQAELQQQKQLYKDILTAYLELPREYADTFITWGIGDAQSWIPYTFSGYGGGLWFDEDWKPKPAFYGIEEVLLAYVE
ncbi:endo-1,4-beta-xylanase [Spirochaeta dissipatitropha]